MVDMEDTTPRFVLPDVNDTPNGWGPNAIPEQYRDMPYQPFSKGDRLGKVADWTGNSYQDRRNQNKYASQFGAGSSQYAYYHDDDETSFQLVDTTRVQKPIYARGRYMRNQRGGMRGRGGGQQMRGGSQMQVLSKGGKKQRSTQPKWQRQQTGRGRFDNRGGQQQTKNRESSVTVQPSWIVIEEMDFPRLSKLSLPSVKEGEDLYKCGELECYDKTYDRVNVKGEKKLIRIDRDIHRVTTTDDPIIRKLAKTEGNVYATDLILATLMCCTRSNYSWDIVVQKIGDKLFFDKRDASDLDLLTVSETSNEPPVEEGAHINSPQSLSLEATFINHNFTQQVLKQDSEKFKFENENPFATEEDRDTIGSIAYRYRKWDLGGSVLLVARTEHDAIMTNPNGEQQLINIKALNEWDPRFSGGVDWRQKLDSQRGAVLAQELKNNANKLAKWTVQAVLASSDQMKFGYVSRRNIRDPGSHVILGIQQFKPSEFANQINLNMDNAWGILRCIIDICMKQENGKYLIVKDPNKPMIRLYKVPDNAFESEDEEGSDEFDED